MLRGKLLCANAKHDLVFLIIALIALAFFFGLFELSRLLFPFYLSLILVLLLFYLLVFFTINQVVFGGSSFLARSSTEWHYSIQVIEEVRNQTNNLDPIIESMARENGAKLGRTATQNAERSICFLRGILRTIQPKNAMERKFEESLRVILDFFDEKIPNSLSSYFEAVSQGENLKISIDRSNFLKEAILNIHVGSLSTNKSFSKRGFTEIRDLVSFKREMMSSD